MSHWKFWTDLLPANVFSCFFLFSVLFLIYWCGLLLLFFCSILNPLVIIAIQSFWGCLLHYWDLPVQGSFLRVCRRDWMYHELILLEISLSPIYCWLIYSISLGEGGGGLILLHYILLLLPICMYLKESYHWLFELISKILYYMFFNYALLVFWILYNNAKDIFKKRSDA